VGNAVDNEAISFTKVSFTELAGWQEDDHAAAFAALLKSCRKTGGGGGICTAATVLGEPVSRDVARVFFEDHYTPHRIEGSAAPGLVTGYYEPELRGSRVSGGEFRIPVYRRPDDLVALTPDTMRARFNDQLTAMRRSGEELVPYFSRAEIEAGALQERDLELLYLDDPVELFYMQVQGSGLVHLADGTTARLSYAGKSGHPYISIGRLLIECGEIAPEVMSMDAVKTWLRADRERGRRLMQQNRSYVFFRELWAEEAEQGPVGAEGVALTEGRSLAVDPSYHALGTPIFVAAPELANEAGKPFRRLMIAQDVGSAIRGSERGDIFWGTGEQAGAIAGSTRHAAHFFIFLPESEAASGE
jgi:membrane-bound lytic murein transglycosylase A